MPILIVGGGRWAKVWASVIAAAHNTPKNIGMVARTDASSLREWVKLNSNLNAIPVYSTIAEAVNEQPLWTAAIVCSRPANHLSDTLEVYKHGLHVMVEKPISVNAAGSRLIASRSAEVGRSLAVGTEFSYLPALHQCYQEFVAKQEGFKKISLTWEDPSIESRYGSQKIRHEENTLLNDLLPHAYSIFRVLASNDRLNITHAHQRSCGSIGAIQFQDQSSRLYDFDCNVSSKHRVRLLEIEANTLSATLDFTTNNPCIKINGRVVSPDPSIAKMTSTLRLELGAFTSQITGSGHEGSAHQKISNLLDLQDQLEKLTSQPYCATAN